MNEQARHRLHAESGSSSSPAGSTDCRFTSGCSPPRLAATQLPSITEPTTGSGTDFHRADKAPSRGALIPAKAGIHGGNGTGWSLSSGRPQAGPVGRDNKEI